MMIIIYDHHIFIFSATSWKDLPGTSTAACLSHSKATEKKDLKHWHQDGFATAKDSGNYHDACMAAVKGQVAYSQHFTFFVTYKWVR